MTEAGEHLDLSELLTRSGWHPGRRVDVEDVLSVWRQGGYRASSAAVEFVQEFNGLELAYPRYFPEDGVDGLSLDAVSGTRGISQSLVREYEERVHEELCPVGRAASGHMTLVIGPSGKVYAGYDKYLAVFGENWREALSNIINRVQPPRIP
ncbi:SUKH-3 domain-containing protein [Micromonospora sp. L32]|uniref:SUKH-3 domain-containing protein n=1 Tax=Micromonospora TaxID=1873 RepID=UPI003F892CEE